MSLTVILTIQGTSTDLYSGEKMAMYLISMMSILCFIKTLWCYQERQLIVVLWESLSVVLQYFIASEFIRGVIPFWSITCYLLALYAALKADQNQKCYKIVFLPLLSVLICSFPLVSLLIYFSSLFIFQPVLWFILLPAMQQKPTVTPQSSVCEACTDHRFFTSP